MANRSSSARSSSVLPRWLGQLFGWSRRCPYRRPQATRLSLEQLESRLVPTVTFAGLQLETMANGNTQITKAGANAPPVALVLTGGVTFNPNDTSGLLTTNGAVDLVVSGGPTVELLQAKPRSFNASALLGGAFALGGADGVTVGNSDAKFTVSGVTLTADGVDLQGSATLPGLGLTFSVQNPGALAISTSGIHFTTFDVDLANQSFTAQQLGFNLTGAHLHYSATDDSYAISGSASVTVAKTDNFTVDLGDQNNPGLVLQHDDLESLNVAVSGAVQVASLAIQSPTDNPLRLQYDANQDTFAVTGSASFQMASQEVDITLGGNGTNGIVINDGTLFSFDATVNANIHFPLKGLNVQANDLTVEYQAASGQSPQMIEVYGGLSVSTAATDGTLNAVTAHIGDQGDPGLQIVNGNLQEFKITLDGGFSLFGIGVSPENLTIDYNAGQSQLQVTGGLKAEIGPNIGGEVQFAGNGMVIDTATGTVQLNDPAFDLHADFGVLKIDDLAVSFAQDSSGTTVSAKGEVEVAGEFDIGGSITIHNGTVSSLGIKVAGVQIAIGDTGLFLTEMDGYVDNLDDLPQLDVQLHVEVSAGPKVDDHAVLTADGMISVTQNDLQISGTVNLLDGVLAKGTGTFDINWATGIYSADISASLYGGIFDFNGSIVLDNSGNITVQAQAQAQVPPSIPVIGGTTLAAANFLMQIRPGDAADTFAAAWTTLKIPLIFTTEDLSFGFKMGLDLVPHALDGGDVNQLLASAEEGDSQIATVWDGWGFPVPSPAINAYDFAVSWKPFSDPNYGTFGQAVLEVQVQTQQTGSTWLDLGDILANPQQDPYYFSVNPIDPAYYQQSGNHYLPPYVLAPPGADSSTRLISINKSDLKPGYTPTQFEVKLGYSTAPAGNNGTPTASASFWAPAPTVAVSSVAVTPRTGATTFTLDATAFTPQAQLANDTSTTVSLYYDTNNQGYDGTLIASIPYQQFALANSETPGDLSRTTTFTWADLPNVALPGSSTPVYFYATIDDGQHPVQNSSYTASVLAPDPTPVLTGPTFIQPVAQSSGHPVTFSAANQTALVVADNVLAPVELNLSSSDGGTFSKDGQQVFQFGIARSFGDAADATAFLDGITYQPQEPFSGRTVVYLQAISRVDAQAHTTELQIPIVMPNTHLVVTQTVDKPHALQWQTIALTVQVSNRAGPNVEAATGVTVTAPLPVGMILTAATPNIGTYNPTTGVWTIGNLAVGATETLHLTAVLDTGTEGKTLIASARVQGDQPDFFPGDLSSQLTQRVPQPIYVTTLEDPAAPISGLTSLRDALNQANASPGYHVISMQIAGTIDLNSPLPTLTGIVDILGSGAKYLTIRPAPLQNFQVFDIAASAIVTIADVQLADGSATQGGAIANAGTLQLERDELTSNSAGVGGAIDNSGTLTINASTITNNFSDSSPLSGGPVAPPGGAVYSTGTLTVTNSTITANQASFNAGGVVIGGGAAHLEDVTITGNSVANLIATDGNNATGGLKVLGGNVTLVNDLIVGNGLTTAGQFMIATELDVGGQVTGAGNLIGVDTGVSGIDNSDAQVQVDTGVSGIYHGAALNQLGTAQQPIDPMLGPLQDNTGPTSTQALLTGSPAIGAGIDLSALTTDQRGTLRPLGYTDIGAYEVQRIPGGVTTTNVASSSVANTATYGNSVTFTATVTNTSGSGWTPTGSVEFFDGPTDLGAGSALSGSGITATSVFTISTLIVSGSPHDIHATYLPTQGFVSSSGDVLQNITPATLTATIIGNPSKVYDGTTNATLSPVNYRLSGLVNGDRITISQHVGSYNSKDVTTATSVTVHLDATYFSAAAGTLVSNYILPTSASGLAQITPAPLTVTATGLDKTYDGTTTAHALLSDNRIAGDSFNEGFNSATFADKNAGTGKVVTVTGISLVGPNARDYTFNTTATTTADVLPQALTVTVTGVSKVYDGTTSATLSPVNYRLSGLVNGDNFTISQNSGNYNSKDVATATSVTVYLDGSVFGAATGTLASNYTLPTSVSGPAQITPAPLTVTATGLDKTYDGTTTAAVDLSVDLSDNRIAGDSFSESCTSATFADKNAGTGKVVTVTGISLSGDDAGDYTPNTTATTTADVLPQALLVTVTGVSKVYDGTTSATVTLSDDALAGDAVSVSYASASFADKHAGSGKTVTVSGLTLTGADAGNYFLSASEQTLQTTADITPAALTVTVVSIGRNYGRANPGFTSTVSGLQNGDALAVNYSTTATATSDPGNYAINATLDNSSTTLADYTATVIPGTLTIVPASALVALHAYNGTYDGTAHGLSGSVTGVFGEDLSNWLDLGASYTDSGDNVVHWSFAGNKDYQSVSDTATIDIAQVPLTVKTNAALKYYGSANPSFTVNYSGFVAGEGPTVLSGSLGFATPATASSDVGAYAVTPNGLTDANYAITYQSGTLSVAPVTLLVPVGSVTRTYGTANPPFAGSILGVQNNDPLTASYSTAATTVSAIGNYAINVTLSDGGTGKLARDYIPIILPGTLTITPAPLTVTANNQSMAYGSALPALTASYSGFVNGDTPASLPMLPILSTPAMPISPVGSYVIDIDIAPALDYTITAVTGTLTVNPATRTTLQPSAVSILTTQVLVLTATVTPLSPLAPGSSLPTGSVSFRDGTTTYTTPVNSSGVAILPLPPRVLSAGIHFFTATYSGDANFQLSPPSAPVIVQVFNPLSAVLSGDTGGVRGQHLNFTVTATDPAGGSTFAVNWGDGSSTPISASAAGSTTPLTHVYTDSGTYSVQVTATNPSGNTTVLASQSVTVAVVAVEADPNNPSGSILAVGGTTDSDIITVSAGVGGLTANVNGVSQNCTAPAGHSFSRILVFGQAGDDLLEVLPQVTVNAELHGGSGNDVLLAGSGNDILLGGSGNDTLTGGSGQDLLIGGSGSDMLIGSSGQDILIAGSTAYDTNDAALQAILMEWSSGHDYTTCVDNILGVTAQQGNSGFATRLNGNDFLNVDTVPDDATPDTEIGGAGMDWFFANLAGGDIVLGATPQEVITNINPTA